MGFKSLLGKSMNMGKTVADPLNMTGKIFGDKGADAAAVANFQNMFKEQNERARNELNAQLAKRPAYESIIGSPEFTQQKQYAFGDESSKGFLMQRAREQQQLQDALQSQTQGQLGGQANAYSQLAMGGGLSSGARERIASGGAQSGLLARQQLRAQGTKNMADLGIAEEGQRFQTRGGVLQSQMEDMSNKNQYAQDAWKTGAQTLAGLSQAENQQNAALVGRAPDKGMCCFIFIEANALSPIVRRYRDEHMTVVNRRGYYKLAEILVPLMRQSKLVKLLIKISMTKPLEAYGQWHYNKTGIGFIFKPIKDFWMKAFNFFGGDHQFKRDNGEII